MNLKEFYRCEGFIEDFKCIEGGWIYKFTEIIDDTIPIVKPQLEFIDSFGKLEKKIVNIGQPADDEDIHTLLPITSRIFLMKCRYIIDNGGETEEFPWTILEIDLAGGKYKLGADKFDCALLDNIIHFHPYKPIVDRAAMNNDDDENLWFLIYKKDLWTCIHCKIDIKKLKFEQLGSTFELRGDLFNCLSLNGNIIYGLPSSLTAISSFNLSSRTLLSPMLKVSNLPPAICLNLKNTKGFTYLPPVGAWTPTKLYLWSEKKTLEKDNDPYYSSNLHVIDLASGIATQLPQTFDGQIREIFINENENLIVRLEKYLRQKKYFGMTAPYFRSYFEFKLLSSSIE